MNFEITGEIPAEHSVGIERLFRTTFGPGHFAKTAERLREFGHSLPNINRIAQYDGKIVGVCRVWPIQIENVPALFFGPVAVSPSHRGQWLGQQVTSAALEAARQQGHKHAVLIGALSYFGDTGFARAPLGHLTFEGPQDPSRILVQSLQSTREDVDTFPQGRVSAPLDAKRATQAQETFLREASRA